MFDRLVHSMRRTVEKRTRGTGGFTLIELLVVIAILGILAGIVVFSTRGIQDKGQASAYAEDARTLRTAQEVFCGKFGQYATEQQLAGQSPAPDGSTVKYIAEPSSYHAITLKSGGPCNAAGNAAASGFDITCNVAETGCGAGGAQATGGTLLLPMGTSDFGTLNAQGINPAITSQGTVHTVSEIFFNGLLRWNASNQLEPDLAASMPVATTTGLPAGVGQRVTVNLKPNVKFHTTAYFTPTRDLESQDVLFSFSKALLPFHSRTSASMRPALCNGTSSDLTGAECSGTPGIQTPTPLQVVFNFKYVYGPLNNQLNVTETPIISKEWYETCTFTANISGCPSSQNLRPIGTGPFKLAAAGDYNSGVSVTGTKHGNYFRGPTLPYFDKVVQAPKSDPATALVNGDVDTSTLNGAQQNAANVVAAKNAGTIKFVTGIPRGAGGGNCITTLGFNLWKRGDSPDADKGTVAKINDGTAALHPILSEGSGAFGLSDGPGTKVRRALSHAMKRSDALSQVQFNEGQVAKYPIDSRITWAHPNPADITPQYNVATADALLDAAGWTGARVTVNSVPNIRTKDGVNPLRLEVVTPPVASTPGQWEVGEILKSSAAAVGVYIDHNTTTWAAGGNQPTQAFNLRAFDISIASYCNGDDPEVGVRRQIDPLNISTTTFSNMAGYKDPAMSTLLNNAVQGATLAARGTVYQQIQDKLVAEAPYIWVTQSETTRGVRANCSGFNTMNTGLFVEPGSCTR